MSKTKLRHIVISEENFQNLRKLGLAGDSFNDVINSLIEKVDSRNDLE